MLRYGTNVGFLERRRIVDSVPGHCDHETVTLKAFDDDQLLLRWRPSEDELRVLLDDHVEVCLGHRLQIAAGYHASSCVPSIVNKHFAFTDNRSQRIRDLRFFKLVEIREFCKKKFNSVKIRKNLLGHFGGMGPFDWLFWCIPRLINMQQQQINLGQ